MRLWLKPDIAPDMIGQFAKWWWPRPALVQCRRQQRPGHGDYAMGLDQFINGCTNVAAMGQGYCIHIFHRPLARGGPHHGKWFWIGS